MGGKSEAAWNFDPVPWHEPGLVHRSEGRHLLQFLFERRQTPIRWFGDVVSYFWDSGSPSTLGN